MDEIFGERRIASADGNDLVIDPLFVAHPHQADGSGWDNCEGMYRLACQHQNVERVAISTESTWDEAVVGRLMDGTMQNAIKPQQTGYFIKFIFVVATPGDFNNSRKR